MRRFLWAAVFLLFGLSGVLAACESSTIFLTPTLPSPLSPTATVTANAPTPLAPSSLPSWVGLWRLPKGQFFLISYRGPQTPQGKVWEEAGRLRLPQADSWDLLPASAVDSLWLQATRPSGWTYWRVNVADLHLKGGFSLSSKEGTPLDETSWRPEGITVVLQTAPSEPPCWKVWRLGRAFPSDSTCADTPSLLGGKVSWPLGWLDGQNLFGLRAEVTQVTPTVAGAPNLRPTGQWEILLVDATTGHVRVAPLPPMPIGHRHPLSVLTAHVRRLALGKAKIIAVASDPHDSSCPTWMVSGVWDAKAHSWEHEPKTQCVPLPVLRFYPLPDALLWLRGSENRPDTGTLLLQRAQRTVEQPLSAEKGAFWAWWAGSTSPREWQDGVLLSEQRETAQGLVIVALYWLPLNGHASPRRLALPPAPDPHTQAQLVALWPLQAFGGVR